MNMKRAFLLALVITTCGGCVWFPNGGTRKSAFVGKWLTKHGGMEICTIISEDGTFKVGDAIAFAGLGTGIITRDGEGIMSGKWKIKGDKIVWTYDEDNPLLHKGEEDINDIIEMTKESFTVREMDGSTTRFVRAKVEDSTEKKEKP